ncbi:LolA family protein [Limnoglobus roseus]|uniref:TIGR03009 domain-containing protein n=1 Tax=Limnoglobus roseus TaxID=2598579 RepID=A0A5C1ALH2_9BACT|nr:hypothetical protein [Limnoglobus roseus]QEL19037.1 hypothetical protein PX52LOC_06091 [Limnoglobus roseus]
MLAASLFLGFNSLIQTARLEDIYSSWAQAQKGMSSLVVEFDYERSELIRRRTERGKGTFCLLRGKDGRWSASFRVAMAEPGPEFLGLLLDRKIYDLDTKAKQFWEYTPDDPQRFLTQHFFPMTVLLNRDRADDTVRLGIDRHEQWYTHLSMTPKRQPWKPALFDTSLRGLVVVMNADTPEVPRNMPRVIVYSQDYGQRTIRYDVRKWRINPKDGVDEAEFVDPRQRDGWKIVRWPSLPLKLPKAPAGRAPTGSEMDKYE